MSHRRSRSIESNALNIEKEDGISTAHSFQNAAQKRMKFLRTSISSVNDKRRHLENLQVSETPMTSKDLRSVSMFWFEKFLILLNTTQLYCLEWILSQYWSWPYNWLAYTRFLCGFNLDFFSMSDRGAGMARSNGPYSVFGEMIGYHKLAILYSVIPLILYACYTVAVRLFQPNATNWLCVMRMRSRLYSVFIFLLLMIHCPVTLAVLRFTACDDGVVTAQPSVECGSPFHTSVCFLIVGLWAAYTLILLGYMFGIKVSQQITYDRTLDHERSVQQQELQYILHLNDNWLVDGTACMASFNRRGLYTHFLNTVEKTVLILVYLYFRFSKKGQAILFWMVFTIFTVRQLAHRSGGPFRCQSSNIINIICRVMLFMDYTLGMMTGYGVQSSMLVASNQSFWLFSINGMATLLVGSYITFIFLKGDTWPTDRTLQVIFRTTPEAGKWLDLVRSTREMLLDCATIPAELVPIGLIEVHMKHLRECWLYAKSQNSILEGIIRECLDECAFAHQEYRPQSLLPANTLEHEIAEATPYLVERRKNQALMNTKKKAILMKLLAIRAFEGNRKVAREQPIPDRPKAIQYASRHLEEESESIRLLIEDSVALSMRAQSLNNKELEETKSLEFENSIRDMVNEWKSTIRTWERNFQTRYGRKPSKADREHKRLYYKNYRKLRNLLDEITHADVQHDVELGMQREDGLTLTTEKVIAHANSNAKETLDEIIAISKNWKKVIKKWEREFEEEHGQKPNAEDKKRRKSWYQNYKEVKELQKKLSAAEKEGIYDEL